MARGYSRSRDQAGETPNAKSEKLASQLLTSHILLLTKILALPRAALPQLFGSNRL